MNRIRPIPALVAIFRATVTVLNLWILVAEAAGHQLGYFGILFFSLVPGYSVVSFVYRRATVAERALASSLLSLSLLVGVSGLPRGYSLPQGVALELVATISLGFIGAASGRSLVSLTKAPSS